MIIEGDSFALGMPTHVEMLQQHARLADAECDQLRLELDGARVNIEKLVAIHQAQAAQISRLKAELAASSKALNLANVEIVGLKNRAHWAGTGQTWGGAGQPPT